MTREKRGTVRNKKRKRMLKRTKGYQGARSKTYRAAKQASIKAGQYAYRDRKTKKRQNRKLWIVRFNAAAREAGLSYSQAQGLLKKEKISLDRKILAELAVKHPKTLKEILKGLPSSK